MKIRELPRMLALLDAMYKDAADKPSGKIKRTKRKHSTDLLRAAYPDYGKSLVSQRKINPNVAGAIRGAKTGLAGAAIAALAARLLTDNPALVGAGAAGGAALGAIPGFISGKHEAESEKTKNLALRRLGINNPAELMIMNNSPMLAKALLEKGVYL